jgi:hypothetical protein
MLQCHRCGTNMLPTQVVYRAVRTSSYFSRSVKLCPQCDALEETNERSQKIKKVLLAVAAIVALIGACVYLLIIK